MRLLVILTLLTSCGFTGEKPFAGARQPEVAPWQDEGPITICDGTQRLGIPGSDAVGSCAGTPTPCSADKDCRSRESCVCGRCLIAICDTADECAADHVCTFDERRCDRACSSDGDCAKGEHCSPGKGVCRGSCAQSSDCQAGEECRVATGECEIATCADDTSCSSGRACRIERVPSDLREPWPILAGSGMTLFFERDDVMGGPELQAADSTDGRHFSVSVHLFPGRAPSVILQKDGSYLMAYMDPRASELWLAQSANGQPWQRLGNAPIAAPARSPSLLPVVDGLAVYYDLGGQLLRAHSTDARVFDPGTPVLSPGDVTDAVLWRNVDQLGQPFVESQTDPDGKPFVRLWFAGDGVETGDAQKLGQVQPTPPDFSIGEASSYDGKSFTPYPFEPVFDRAVNFLEHPSELEPAVIAFGGQRLLYYRRAGSALKSEGLAVAHSPVDPPKN